MVVDFICEDFKISDDVCIGLSCIIRPGVIRYGPRLICVTFIGLRETMKNVQSQGLDG